MALTQEQVQEARLKYGLDTSIKTESSRVQRLRKIAETGKVGEEVEEGTGVIGQIATGAGKGILSTIRGASGLAEKGFRAVGRAVLPKSLERGLEADRPTAAEELISEEAVTPETTAEKVGFGVEQVAEFFVPIPGLRTAKIGAASTRAGKAALEAGEVAGRTALQTGEFGETEVLAGASAPIVGGVLSKAGEALFKNLPERLVRKAIGQTKKELIAGKDVSRFALDKKKFGTAKSILDDSQKEIDRLDTEVNSVLKSIPVTLDKVSLKKIATDVAGDINEKGGEISSEEVLDIVKKLTGKTGQNLINKTTLGLSTANNLRSKIDKTLGDRGFLADKLPENKEILRQFTNTLRAEVQNKAPKTKALFSDYSNEIRLRDALLDTVAQKDLNKSLGLTDLLVGAGFGATAGLPTAVGVVGAKKVLESTPFLTGAGVTLDQLRRAAPILEKLTPAERATISQIIQQLLQ